MKPRRIILFLLDLILLAAAWVLAYSLRFDFTIPDDVLAGKGYVTQLKMLLPWIVGTHLLLHYLFHLYRGMLRYAGMEELKAIVLSAVIHVAGWSLFNLFLESQETFFSLPLDGEAEHVLRVPRSIFPIYFLLAVFLIGGLRFSRRLFLESASRQTIGQAPTTLIVGAGNLADSVIRSLRREGGDFKPVCAVTVDKGRVGLRLHGIPVVGMLEKIPRIISEREIGLVLIALEDPTPEILREVIGYCERASVNFRIVPTLSDIAGGRVAISKTREIRIEDLLGREPVDLGLPPERNYCAGECVLITGAGGSIGSEMARQVARLNPAALVLLGKGENSIFEIQQELRQSHSGLKLHSVVADIRDPAAMDQVFERLRPSIVFHAAAHKHVPLMEDEPEEAVKNNVLGTAVLAHLAHEYGSKRFILISTDKAVRPTSVMGVTKRIAEMVVFGRAQGSETCFAAVRFGNVLGSRGSVIPLFRRQIAAGGPVTVTHPDVTRYFMTIPEAVNLVLQAGSQAENGRLYLLDMGSPVRIADLARNMITLSGYKPDEDIKIEYVGMRPGEKLHEELLSDSEGARPTEIPKVQVTSPAVKADWETMQRVVMELMELAQEGSQRKLIRWFEKLVPEFQPQQIPEDGEPFDLDAKTLEAREKIRAMFAALRKEYFPSVSPTERPVETSTPPETELLTLPDAGADVEIEFSEEVPPLTESPEEEEPEAETPIEVEQEAETDEEAKSRALDLFQEEGEGEEERGEEAEAEAEAEEYEEPFVSEAVTDVEEEAPVPRRESVRLVLLVPPGSDPGTVHQMTVMLKTYLKQEESGDDLKILTSSDEREELEQELDLPVLDFDSEGVWSEVAESEASGIMLVQTSEVLPMPGAFEAFLETLKESPAALAFSRFEEILGEETRLVDPLTEKEDAAGYEFHSPLVAIRNRDFREALDEATPGKFTLLQRIVEGLARKSPPAVIETPLFQYFPESRQPEELPAFVRILPVAWTMENFEAAQAERGEGPVE